MFVTPQNNFGESHPAGAKFWCCCLGQFWCCCLGQGFWGSGWKKRGSPSLWDQPGGNFSPWGRRCSKPWANSSSAGYLSPCLYLVLKAFLELTITKKKLLIFLKSKYWERLKNVNFLWKLFSRRFRNHCCSFLLPVVPVSLKWPQGADTAFGIFWDVLSKKL